MCKRMSSIRFGAVAVAAAFASSVSAQSSSHVPTISATHLAELLAGPHKVIVLDIREREEFLISRIPGALNFIPATERDYLAKRLSKIVPGKTVVLYCTLGARSTDFTIFVDEDLKKLGATSILVLSGGIVGWHNEQRALVDRKGATKFIHPFSIDLMQSIKRPHFTILPASK